MTLPADWIRLAAPDDIGGLPGDLSANDKVPVQNVTWADCSDWCMANDLRLPSETEWEYACRAGTRSRFSCGDRDSYLFDHAWCIENSGGRAQDVASKPPNAFGLHDMHGNLWEWCQDHYRGSYVNTPRDGRPVSDSMPLDRVLRGGAWNSLPEYCRSGYRNCAHARFRSDFVSFRAARSVR